MEMKRVDINTCISLSVCVSLACSRGLFVLKMREMKAETVWLIIHRITFTLLTDVTSHFFRGGDKAAGATERRVL
jgi:hypothetical protein